MKAISLWQPWASAMALGLKTIETRHWWTSHRGLTLIHAAKRWTRQEREFAEEMGLPPDLPLGTLVAIGDLYMIRRTEMFGSELSREEEQWGNYAPRRYGWMFRDVRALPEPIPYRGAQGFFDVPDELVVNSSPPAPQAQLL